MSGDLWLGLGDPKSSASIDGAHDELGRPSDVARNRCRHLPRGQEDQSSGRGAREHEPRRHRFVDLRGRQSAWHLAPTWVLRPIDRVIWRIRVTWRSVVESFEDRMRRGGGEALRAAGEFFMGTDDVHQSLRRIASRLDQIGIPYAVGGGMALVAHGYARTTVDVDVLLPAGTLERVHSALDGSGYVAPFAGSRDLRDAETGVRIEFPGNGQPKPVSFPEPARGSVVIGGIRYLALERLVELTLASGMTHAGRIKDLADVQELIRILASMRPSPTGCTRTCERSTQSCARLSIPCQADAPGSRSRAARLCSICVGNAAERDDRRLS